MKINEITPQLFVRSNLKRYPPEYLRSEIDELGIKAVVSLVKPPIYQLSSLPFYSVYAIPDSKMTLAIETELNYLAEKLVEFIKRGEKVMINCNAGRNRSCLLAALVLIRVNGWTGKKALEFVREKRPRAIANPHYEKYLLSLVK